VNIRISNKVPYTLKKILYYRNKEFQSTTFEEPGLLRIYKGSEYRLKFYDKGITYLDSGNLMRIEIVLNKMRHLVNQTLKLADLIDRDIYLLFSKYLIEIVNDIVYDDDFIAIKLTKKERNLYIMIKDVDRWSALSKQTRSLLRQTYSTMVNIKGTLKLKNELNMSCISTLTSLGFLN